MKKREFIVSYFIIFITLAGYGIIIPYLPKFQSVFQLSQVQVGLIISLYALGQFFFSPLWGVLLHKYSEKSIIRFSLLSYTIFMLLTFYVNSYALLLLCRFMAGVFASALFPSAENYVAVAASKDSPEKVTRSNMLLASANGLGIVFGPILGGYMLLQKDINIVSVSFIIVAILITFASGFLLKEHQHNAETNVKEETAEYVRVLKNLLRHKELYFIFYIFLLYGVITSSLESNGLTYIVKVYNAYIDIPIIQLVVFGIVAILIYWFYSKQEKKYGYYGRFIFLSILSFVPLALLSLFFMQNFYVIMLGISFLAIAFTYSTLISFIMDTTKNSGIVIASKNSFITLGMSIGPIIVGYFFDLDQNFIFIPILIGLLVMFIISVFKVFNLTINRKSTLSICAIILLILGTIFYSSRMVVKKELKLMMLNEYLYSDFHPVAPVTSFEKAYAVERSTKPIEIGDLLDVDFDGVSDFSVLGHVKKPSGFDAFVVHDLNGKYIVSIRGTEVDQEDFKTDAILGLGLIVPQQFTELNNYLEQLVNNPTAVKLPPDLPKNTITFTGHSLGGGLSLSAVNYLETKFNIPAKAVAINPSPFVANVNLQAISASTKNNSQIFVANNDPLFDLNSKLPFNNGIYDTYKFFNYQKIVSNSGHSEASLIGFLSDRYLIDNLWREQFKKEVK
ncbi:MAG: MFS transporter [Mycoplasmatales bacterium]